MAISFVGSAKNAVPSGTGNTTITLPAGMSEDDIVVIGTSNDRNAVSAPTGYTEVRSYTVNLGLNLSYKFMGATPDSSVDIARTSNSPSPTCIGAYRGVNTSTPEDATHTVASGGTGLPNPASITTVTDNAWVIALGGLDDDDQTDTTAPTGYSDLINQTGGESPPDSSTTMVATKEVTSAGAEDPGAFGGSGDDAWQTITWAMRPAAAGSVVPQFYHQRFHNRAA